MKTQKTSNILIIILLLLSFPSNIFSITVNNLRCEMLNNPLGIDNISPHLSWQLESSNNGAFQKAYRIIAASSKELLDKETADLWDSGKTNSQESIWIDYKGKKLSSNSMVFWKVCVWDNKNRKSEWSEDAFFSVGLLNPEDWKADFIGLKSDAGESQSPIFRNKFILKNTDNRYLLHVNSLGYHEAYINGKKISDNILAPAMAQFDKRSLIITYDVTSYLVKGENDIVVWLGKGWYRDGLPGVAKGGPFVRAQIMEINEGKANAIVCTNDSWQAKESGYTTHGSWRPENFGGEILNAGDFLKDFSAETLDNAQWGKTYKANIAEHLSTPQMCQSNKIKEAIKPVSLTRGDDNTIIIDMGKCLTGVTKIDFPKLDKGQKIQINYCDFFDSKNNFIDSNNYDIYIASGLQNETFMNKFNYHAYRYIKIRNLTQNISKDNITAYLVRTDFDDSSSFECSDNELNSIHDMIHYTLQCLTLGGYMVDCPHIERLGYGGDGNASTLTVQTMYNLSPLYYNWMQAWKDCIREDGGMPHTAPCPYSAGGGPFWCGFIITASWQTYQNYGDKRLLELYYPQMEQWISYAEKYSNDGMLGKWPNNEYRNWYLGDWAGPTGVDVTDSSSVALVSNCFLSDCYDRMNKISTILGKTSEAESYLERRDALRDKIQDIFYNDEKNTYASASQIDMCFPMLSDITPDDKKEKVIESLISLTENKYKGHLSTGLVGIPIITQWATKEKQGNFIMNMLKKHGYPGYLYMIDNGATTTWEHWNGARSHIHNCYNGIGSWFYQAVAGIIRDDNSPAYKHFFLRPQNIDDITSAKAEKETPYGIIRVSWNIEGDNYKLSSEIPVGCSATVELPLKTKSITINGRKFKKREIKLSSGKYEISAKIR
ncbi:MAG: family 78 glycoside hydrolase catalytic domain [Bacteroidales bacterium]|nr:family 78 glycoside hydrolase catalytic domain [Bacteroidales bacterium]